MSDEMPEESIFPPDEDEEILEEEIPFADTGAEMLLPAVRQPRVEPEPEESSYQQTARGRITALPFALGLISLGVLLLAENQVDGLDITLPVAALIMVAALVLTNLFRFFASGRRERGLLFLALVTLSLGAVIAVMSIAQLDAHDWWPLSLVGVMVALLITFIADQQHERGLLGLGFLILVAAVVALAVTLGVIPQGVIDEAGDYYPLAIAFIGVTLIPLALRRSA
ncbi:MAG TPA: hypothetical protein VJZ27_13610, partial [Aggregatilineales bacterium]|nr:hypothetical protein [Aggregatilineales bacterium]